MRKYICLSLVSCILGAACALHGQDAYPIVHNLQFVPNYEYINSMAMTGNNKDYYDIFIVVFQNKGPVRLPVNDDCEIVTSKGEKHKAGFHPMVAKHVESKRKFKAESGKIKFIGPGETKYVVAIFDPISDGTPSF